MILLHSGLPGEEPVISLDHKVPFVKSAGTCLIFESHLLCLDPYLLSCCLHLVLNCRVVALGGDKRGKICKSSLWLPFQTDHSIGNYCEAHLSVLIGYIAGGLC